MALNSEQVSRAADMLADARRKGSALDGLPADLRPTTMKEAEAIRDGLAFRLGGRPIGWKAGFTAPSATKAPGYLGYMTGPMFAETLLPNPATVKRSALHFMFVEAEVGFRMAQALPARGKPYSEGEVVEAVGTAMAAIELAGSSYREPMAAGGAGLTADLGAAYAFIPGPAIADWRKRDLTKIGVELLFDGKSVGRGLEGDARCNPVEVLVNLANKLAASGRGLQSGMLVTTGAAAAPAAAGTTRTAIARFDGIGDVTVNFA
ncbi:MAG: 2-keto-4-pentenoate hydratase [Alphaproteobacteria bacterium]